MSRSRSGATVTLIAVIRLMHNHNMYEGLRETLPSILPVRAAVERRDISEEYMTLT